MSLRECEECGGVWFSLVAMHLPEIPIHMEPLVNIDDDDGSICGWSGRPICSTCAAALPLSPELQGIVDGEVPWHPSRDKLRLVPDDVL